MEKCAPQDVALKSLFLGPQAENSAWLEHEWTKVLQHWVGWRRSLFPDDGEAISPADQSSPLFRARQESVALKLDQLLRALDGESPKFTPRYLGHMISELSLPALLGHLAVLLHNPNQTSREVSRVTSGLEGEAIGDLLEMVGMARARGRGHFTSGGTLANFESVWHMLHRLDRGWALGLLLVKNGRLDREAFARPPSWTWAWFEENLAEERKHDPQAESSLAAYSVLALGQSEFARVHEAVTGHPYRAPLVLAPASRHYSWPKAVTLLGLGKDSLRDLALDEHGRLSLTGLREGLARAEREGRAVAMLITVAGATGTGAVDPIAGAREVLDEHRQASGRDVWHHVDAAYGGYFCTLAGTGGAEAPGLTPEVARSLQALSGAHSVTLDPHKLGFVPYSCGAFLARDAHHYRSPSFDAPYLLANNEGSWMHTIEGSRSATGVAATWMANQSIGLGAEGYGRLLEKGLQAARELAQGLASHAGEILVFPSDLNIVCFSLCRPGEPLSESNRRTLACFEHFLQSPDFSVSKTDLSASMYSRLFERVLGARGVAIDDTKVTCIRLVLMNPFVTTRETKTRYVSAFLDEVFRTIRP